MIRTLTIIALFLTSGLVEAGSAVDAAREYRESHGAEILAGFADLLRIPNVAGDPETIGKNAVAIMDALAARGAEMQLLELIDASPIVYGTLPARGATRTLGIYVHYDGQPVNEARWTSGPWTPTLYDRAIEDGGKQIPFPDPGDAIDPEWRLYARSAGDDKAPIPALLAALDALDAADIPLTSNLIFFFEGEEEMGSTNLSKYITTNSDLLQVDAWLICDGPVHQSRRPQLVFGVRGVTGMEITVYGASRNLHSGHYGNWAPNPGMMLAQLLASMRDADGNVVIEGFYESTDPLSPAAEAAIATVPEVDEALMKELGLVRTEGDGNLTERLLVPSLNVQGLSSANVGEKSRNVIPSTAIAAIDIRLVKGNDPEHMKDLVEAHIEKMGYFIVREDPDMETRLTHPRIAKVTRSKGYVAARTSMDHPIVEPLTRAAEDAAGEPVILMPSLGGSLPLYLFTETLNKPVVIVPMANHDDNQHAPDENIRLANLWYGIDLLAAILTMP